MKCPRKMCVSCILATLFEGTIRFKLQNFFAIPPLLPKKPIENILFFLANFKTLIIFLELPDVESYN